jgi:hypothetical protein
MLNADPSLAHLSPLLSPASFVVDGYIGLGVPIGTDAFIQHFVKDECEAIMEDVDKLDSIHDGFIHYQLLRFCQATRLQYLNGHIDLVLQQQHVDHQIANALFQQGHQRRLQDMEPTRSGMGRYALHEPHEGDGFGVTHNTASRRAASYMTNARFVAFLGTFARPAQQVWLPVNDLQDPST